MAITGDSGDGKKKSAPSEGRALRAFVYLAFLGALGYAAYTHKQNVDLAAIVASLGEIAPEVGPQFPGGRQRAAGGRGGLATVV